MQEEIKDAGFVHLREAWYSDIILGEKHKRGSCLMDDLSLSVQTVSGKCMDLAVEWITLGDTGKYGVRIQAFDDSWMLFQLYSGLFADMTRLGENPAPERVMELLKVHGFRDETPRKDPYAGQG